MDLPAAWLRFVQDSLTWDESGAPGAGAGSPHCPVSGTGHGLARDGGSSRGPSTTISRTKQEPLLGRQMHVFVSPSTCHCRKLEMQW